MSAYRPYPKTKPSGVEWLGHVPEEWEVKPLKVIASFNDDVLSESYGEDEEIEYVDIGSVSLETGIERTETFRFGDAPSRARRRVRDGDVIASTVRTYLKAIAPVVAPPANLIVSTGFAVIRPRNGLDSHFAKFSLQSGYFVDEVISRSTGVSYPAINASEMAAISLALPPLPEQRQIAAFLDRECGKLDALQAKQERLIELLKEKRQALISHAVTRGLDPAAKLKPSGIEWLGDVPKHWRVCRVKHVAKLESGHTPSKTMPGYWEDCNIPWVSLNDTKQLKGVDYITETALQISELGMKNSSAHLLPERAVIFTRDATIGLAAITTRPMAVSQHIIAWICKERLVIPEYLLLVFYGMASDLERFTAGATLKTIGMPDVNKLAAAIPPLVEQREIVERIFRKMRNIDAAMAKAERGIELLKERRSALISAAVTGKIDVRNQS